MAKAKKSMVVRLVSQAGTMGYFYTIRRAIKANMEKLQLIKFDPRVNARALSRRRRSRRARIVSLLPVDRVRRHPAFHGGSQRQDLQPTVQSELEKALAKLCKHSPTPTVYFCGRTDAGVHATCATCHVDLVRTNASGAPLPPLTIQPS